MKTFLFSLLLLPLPSLGQSGSISGTIIDGQGEPLPFATIVIFEGDLFVNGGWADEYGKFEIKEIAAGEYSLKIKYLTADTTINNIVVQAGEKLIINEKFNWEDDGLNCDLPITTLTLPAFKKLEPSGMTIKAEEIRRLAY